jgi:dienelactone hydrolase
VSRRLDPVIRLAGLAAVLLVLASGATADEIVLRSGKKHEGFVREQGRELHLNVYGCSVPEMTLGLQRFRAVDVREVRPRPAAVHVHRGLAELGARDVERRVDLLRFAQGQRLHDEVERLAAEILAIDMAHAEALAAFGGAEKWTARQRGDPALDRRLAADLRAVLRLESGAARRTQAERIARVHGYAPGAGVIERMAASAQRDRGLAERPLRLGGKGLDGATYALYVPSAYDATRPTPLLIALHGGGIMHEEGERTRGSARDALAYYLEGAQALGWLLACPTALEAPWPTARNHALIDAVFEEVSTRWNVDLARVHLAGQGGGGDGAWYHATRRGERYASVSVAAAGKPLGATTLAQKTAIWMYHGEADEVVPADPVRKTADALLRTSADFAYCELPREGHGFAPAAKRDLLRFVAPRRRQRAKSAWPRSSLDEPASREAIEVFGDPAAAWGIGFDASTPAEALVGILRAGRTDAEFAARALLERHVGERADLAPAVRKVLEDRAVPRAGRIWAAWLCGRWRDPEAVGVLGDTLRTAKDARLLRTCAEAVGRIGSPDNRQDLRWALSDVSAGFRALAGDRVVHQQLERTCRLGAAIADAVGRTAKGDEDFFADLEEHLVRHVLMDRRRVVFDPESGEDPSAARAHLAEALARAYRRLGAEKTLYDMLLEAVKRDKTATAAVLRGMRQPVR